MSSPKDGSSWETQPPSVDKNASWCMGVSLRNARETAPAMATEPPPQRGSLWVMNPCSNPHDTSLPGHRKREAPRAPLSSHSHCLLKEARFPLCAKVHPTEAASPHPGLLGRTQKSALPKKSRQSVARSLLHRTFDRLSSSATVPAQAANHPCTAQTPRSPAALPKLLCRLSACVLHTDRPHQASLPRVSPGRLPNTGQSHILQTEPESVA